MNSGQAEERRGSQEGLFCKCRTSVHALDIWVPTGEEP